MNNVAELLRSLELGHWLIIVGNILVLVGALGLAINLIRAPRSEQTGD